jgi:aspartate/glutamate racemase
MIDEAIGSLDENVHRPALLATRATVEAAVYRDRLHLSGREEVWSEPLQASVDDLLFGVKRGMPGVQLRDAWSRVLEAVKEEGRTAP